MEDIAADYSFLFSASPSYLLEDISLLHFHFSRIIMRFFIGKIVKDVQVPVKGDNKILDFISRMASYFIILETLYQWL